MKSWVEKYAGESQSLNRRHLFDKADRQNFSTSALKLNWILRYKYLKPAKKEQVQ